MDGKLLTFINEEMHCMLNVTSINNKSLHPDVKNILKAKGYDLVMLFPSRPALGYDISIKMDKKFMSVDKQSK